MITCLLFMLFASLGLPMESCPVQAKLEYSHDLTKWLMVPPPKYDSPQWNAANQSDYTWMVSVQDDKPITRLRDVKIDEASLLPFKVKKSREFGGEQTAIRTDDGWLVGFDHGEFGGSLWWFSPDGKQQYRISYDQVHGFIKTDTGIQAWAGLAHMGIDKGSLLSLNRNSQGHWSETTFVDIHQDPLAVTLDADGNLLIATHTQVLCVDHNKHITPLIKKAFWRGFYPCSIATLPSGTIYVGMRYGVAHIHKQDAIYVADWHLPIRSFADAKPKY